MSDEKKRLVIGYIYNNKTLWAEQKFFIEAAKEKNVELVMFNLADDFDEELFEEKVKKCDLIYNHTDEIMAIELVKTMEEMGKKVIDPSERFYYNEDKWLFYVRCRQNKIAVPETILLPINIAPLMLELEKFNQWPIIIKRIDCSEGRFVEKADNIKQAMKIIEDIWAKSGERMPLIAQEYIKSHSYRVLVIDGKVSQLVLKRGTGWKLTGLFAKRFWKFKPDKELLDISKKIAEITKIKVLGIDLLKKNNVWHVLEANAEPSFSFFDNEMKKIIHEVLNLLIREASSPGKA